MQQAKKREVKSFKWIIEQSHALNLRTRAQLENLCDSVTLSPPESLTELFESIKHFARYESQVDNSSGALGQFFVDVTVYDEKSDFAKAYADLKKNPVIEPRVISETSSDRYVITLEFPPTWELDKKRLKRFNELADTSPSVSPKKISYLYSEGHKYLLERFLGSQRLIPDLWYYDIAPISDLALADLQLYQDLQILRGKLGSINGTRRLTDEERLAAVRRLAEKIPLKLANREAHDELSRMMARGMPYTKNGIRNSLLPALFHDQLKNEEIPERKRINRTEYIQTPAGLIPKVKPSEYTLSTYWIWLKQGVQAALEKWVLESADKPGDKETKRATSPALLGVSYNEWGRIISESEEYDRRRKRNQPKVEIVYESDYDLLTTRKRFSAIEEASPDEANFEFDTFREASAEVEVDDDAGRSLTDMTGPDVSGFEDELLGDDWLSESHLWQDLAHEIEVDPLVVTRTIKSDLTGRQKQYWVALSKIVHDEPDIKIQEARARVNRKLRLTAGNGRQIWDRLKHAAKVRKRNEYYDSLGIRGHALLRPDGTEMRVPSFVLRLLQQQNLIIRGSRPPKLNRAIWGYLRNVCGPQKLKAPNGNYAALRILRTLGVDLSGPREVSCDCSRCRP